MTDARLIVPTAFSPALAGSREVVALVRRLADAQDRDDLVAELDAVARDLSVEVVPVLVVGGAGQGKSSVVNALVGAPVSPVSAHYATSVPVEIGHGTAYSAQVVAEPPPGRGAAAEPRPVAFGDASALASQEFNPGNERRFRVAAVKAPSSTLARGLTLIDSPPIADAWSDPAPRLLRSAAGAAAIILVSSAAAELAAGELDFLRVAGSLCSRIIVVVNGTNRFPEWARVVEHNELLLEQRGISAPVFAVDPSPYWSEHGGVPPGPNRGMQELATYLEGSVVLDTEQQRISRALTETFWVADRLKMRLSAERAVIDNVARIDDARQRLRVAAQDAHDLCGPDARWHKLLDSRLARLRDDLDTDLDADLLRLRSVAGELAREAHHVGGWDAAFTQLHRELAEAFAYRQRVLRLSIRACSREVTEQFHHDWSEIISATEISPEAHALVTPRLNRAALSGPRPLADLPLDPASDTLVRRRVDDPHVEVPTALAAWLDVAENLIRFEMQSALTRAGRDITSRCGARSLELHRSLVEVVTSLSVIGQLDPDAVTQRRRLLASDLEQLHTVDFSVGP
ncbi:MAG: dynamin family protein [Actinobacteria bacterium]|nr:dynamin family protein [Actinomycetota bacterium]